MLREPKSADELDYFTNRTFYDENGNLLEDLVTLRSLEAGAYEVMFLRPLWDLRSQDVSFVKFVAEHPGGRISGFYLYGNRAQNKVLNNHSS